MLENKQKSPLVWVDAFAVGELVSHPRYGDRRYTERQLNEAIQNFRKLKAKGYATTLLREHGREDSYVYGEVHDLRIAPDGYFQGAVEFYRIEDREAYNAGILREFSPGFAHEWIDPHTGETLNNVLIELSFTSRAYQRNLRPPQMINPGIVLSDAPQSLADTPSGRAAITGDPEMEDEQVEVEEVEEESAFDMAAAFSALSEKLDALAAMLKPEEMADEEPAEEMSDDASEIERLSAENAKLRNDLCRMELSAKGIAPERVESLVLLSDKLDKQEFSAVVEMAATKPASTVQGERGTQGAAATTETLSAKDILDEAAKAGATPGTGRLPLWLNKNYADRASEVLEIAG